MKRTPALPHLQLDALREVANIASAHAATALGQLTNRRIMITVPELAVASADEIPTLLGYAGQPVVVVAMHLLGDVTGSLVFLMAGAKAQQLSALLLRRPTPEDGTLDALARSSLTETANIIGGAYAGVLATLMSRVVMISVPALGIEPPDGLLKRLRATEADADTGLCIETRLTCDGELGEFGGHMLLLPNRAALRSILDALQVGG
jgi:chemotaxis protein CheC